MKLSSNDIKNTLIARSKHLIQLSKNNDGIAVLDEAEFLTNLAENIKLFYCHDESEGKRCEKQCDYCVGFEGYTANPNEKGAEYEHKYQREQQANKIKSIWTISKWGNSDVLMCDGVISGITIEEIANNLNQLSQFQPQMEYANNIINKQAEHIQNLEADVARLEAERTELRNKVIDECIAMICSTAPEYGPIEISVRKVHELLNSLKTK